MKKGLYSAAKAKTASPPPGVETKVVVESARRGWRDRYKRHERPLLFVAGALLASALAALHGAFIPAPHEITQEDIDQAVARTLETKPVPSPAVKAYQAVRSSIVRVHAMSAVGDASGLDEYGGATAAPSGASSATGSGVVIIDRGVILTCLHVVAGASKVRVLFEDGLESEATIVSTQPENDLAVLQASRIPDDLRAATLRSARHLVEGEHVTAVGFPFGIGPSVSHGVISGLQREYQAPKGERSLSNLIQFDAAANPGSSGGPLVNAAGEVVGIITAILSTSEKGTFSGIGFAVPIETAAGAAGLPPF